MSGLLMSLFYEYLFNLYHYSFQVRPHLVLPLGPINALSDTTFKKGRRAELAHMDTLRQRKRLWLHMVSHTEGP